jgi:hypothetical protein
MTDGHERYSHDRTAMTETAVTGTVPLWQFSHGRMALTGQQWRESQEEECTE